MGNSCTATWHRYVSIFEHFLIKYFRKWGSFVARHPLIAIIAALTLAVILSAFAFNIQSETSPVLLYAPQDTQSWKNWEKNEDSWILYEDKTRLNWFIATNNDNNVFTLSDLQDLLTIHEYIVNNITVDYQGRTYNYSDICFKYENGNCETNNVLQFYDFDGPTLASKFFEYESYDGLSAINNQTVIYPLTTYYTKAIVTYPLSLSDYSDDDVFLFSIIGSPLVYAIVLMYDSESNIQYLPTLESTPAFWCTYTLDETVFDEELLVLWEEKWLSYLSGNDNDHMLETNFDISYFADYSFNSELLRSVVSDIISFAMAFALLVVFSSLVLLRFKRAASNNWCKYRINFQRSRALMALVGIISSAFAVSSCFGLVGGIFGVKFNSIVSVAPFLLVGLGLDDMFVLLRAYELTNSKMNIEQRMRLTMERGGISILFTSVTDLIAFCVGSNSRFGAVSAFCVYCGVGVFMDFVFQVNNAYTL